MSLRFPGHPCGRWSKCLSRKCPGRVWHRGGPCLPRGLEPTEPWLRCFGGSWSCVGTARAGPAPPRSSSGCSCCPRPAVSYSLCALTSEGEFLSEGLLPSRLLGLRGGWCKKGALGYGSEAVCQHRCLLYGDSVRGSVRRACRVPAARSPSAMEASGAGWDEVVQPSPWLSSRFSH